MKIKLIDIAHGRSGDKGDAANIGIIAYNDKGYEIIKKNLTAEKVKNISPEFVKEMLIGMNCPTYVH
jgi:hypothetical protein